MERPEIKNLIEKMKPGTVLTFTGESEEMTVWKSPRGVLRVGEIEFSVSQAATWVESIRPHSVVDDSEFHSMKTALPKNNPSKKRSNIHWVDDSRTKDESEV
jgi:hypothetical protein